MIHCRPLYCFFALVIISLLSLQSFFQYQHNAADDTVSQSHRSATSPQNTFLSYQAHDGYYKQHEAFLKAMQLALETDRTLIVPPLRLGRALDWEPFSSLERHQASPHCEGSCERGDWTEVPWSAIFDIETVQEQCGIRMTEKKGHDWIPDLNPADITVVDLATFASNHTQPPRQRQKTSWWAAWYKDLQSLSRAPEQEAQEELRGGSLTLEQLQDFPARFLRFGSLVAKWRYQTPMADKNNCLKVHAFVPPTRLAELNETALSVLRAMGGANAFHLLHVNIDALVAVELQGPNGLESHSISTSQHSVEDLSVQARKEMMEALVREVLDEMPIHVAASAMTQILPSALQDLVGERSGAHLDHRERLVACLAYRQTVDQHYPIFFFVTNSRSASELHPDFFGPLAASFPCTFTMTDMYNLGYVSRSWVRGRQALGNANVNYETMLMPILEIMIGTKASSVIEIPMTRLQFFVRKTKSAAEVQD